MTGQQHYEALAQELVVQQTAHAVSQSVPVVVFVAGQPGSGKSLVSDLVHAALEHRGGAVRVDHDQYKAAHPHYLTYLDEDVRTAGVRVRPQTYQWQADVEARVRALRCDAVVETPLADPAAFREKAVAYRKAGYRIEIVALAVPEAVSQLGVLDRYLRLAETGRARYVSWENHDACAAGLLDSLSVIEAEHLAERVTVVRRTAEGAGGPVYANDLSPTGTWSSPTGAAQAVRTERARPWDARETGLFRRQLADADRRAYHTAPGGPLPQDWGLAVQQDAARAAALAEPVGRRAQARVEWPGVDYHWLSADEHQWTFHELIAPHLLERITPQKKPVVVFVLGPPGPLSVEASLLVRRAMRPRPTHIDRGRFLQFHPDYWQLLQEQPQTVAARLRADWRAWQAQAEALVRTHRGDLVIEGAFDNAQQFLDSAALYRRAGYRMELVAVASRPADSRQASAAHYAEVSRLGAPALRDAADEHQARLAVCAEVLRAAERGQAVDSVVVMRSDGTAVHSHRMADRGKHPSSGTGALTAEWTRPYTPGEASRFWALQRQLRTWAPELRAELLAVERLARPLMPGRPYRLPGAVLRARLPLCRTGVSSPAA